MWWGNAMICEQIYCIYNKGNICTVEEISIDNTGMCDACIIVALKSNFLEAEKQRQLNELEERWAKFNTN